jgi:hypothetical protein
MRTSVLEHRTSHMLLAAPHINGIIRFTTSPLQKLMLHPSRSAKLQILILERIRCLLYVHSKFWKGCSKDTGTYIRQLQGVTLTKGVLWCLKAECDRLCGLVVRVLDYRYRCPGFDSRALQKKSSGSGTGSTQPRKYN